MVEKRKPLPVKECVKQIMTYASTGKIDEIDIQESNGRFLAEDIKATHHVPPFDRSPYDGFAIKAKDSEQGSLSNAIEFEVIEEIAAGEVPTKVTGPYQAIRIMTGAQLPSECDAIVMFELTKEYEKDGQKFMSISRSFQAGDNVSFEGEDIQKDTTLIRKGTYINPGVQAVLATFGYKKVKVAKKPVIGVFATGSELLEVDEPLQPGKIRNSNSYMVCAQIEEVGAEAKYFGKLPDDLELCYEAIKSKLDQVDLLITTGGVSVGDYDYLPDIYDRLGANVLFNKIAMRPGSVTTVAEWNGKHLFGLSGNPSACFVGFELFVRPVVRTMLYSKKPHLQKVQAKLGDDFTKPNPFTRFVRSTISFQAGSLTVKPNGFNKSNSVSSLVEANSLIMLPGGSRGFTTGDQVDVLLLEDREGSEWPWE